MLGRPSHAVVNKSLLIMMCMWTIKFLGLCFHRVKSEWLNIFRTFIGLHISISFHIPPPTGGDFVCAIPWTRDQMTSIQCSNHWARVQVGPRSSDLLDEIGPPILDHQLLSLLGMLHIVFVSVRNQRARLDLWKSSACCLVFVQVRGAGWGVHSFE